MRRLLPFLLIAGVASAAAAQQVALRLVASGLSQPVGIAHAGDSRLFIVQQRGRIAIYDGTRILAAPFLDLTARVSCCGEQGLLGLAFHPRYQDTGFFFVNYTDTSGHTVVARYRVSSSDRDRADPASEFVVLRVEQPFANHNGGHLAFGPDGYLYIGLGDGGAGGDPGNRAQNMTNLLGKMLRIDVDSGSPYAIPPTNPFVRRTDARHEIWASGLRNPWRYSFDRESGDLWIGDVGQGSWEEVNHQPATSIGGENYGWRLMEGMHCFNPPANCNNGSLTLPVLEYSLSGNPCAVTGGYVYRGSRYPRLRGMYLYGDYCSGEIWGATRNADGTWSSRLLLDSPISISTFGEDVNGELYVTHHGGGSIHQIIDTSPLSGPRRRAVRH